MKPESKRSRDDKSSCFDNFGEMSKALLDSDVTVKNESSSNILGSAILQDPKAIQSLSKDCYDFSSLLKTLNCIEKKNAKRLIRLGRIQKIKRKEKKKKISIKFIFVKPNKPFEKNVHFKPSTYEMGLASISLELPTKWTKISDTAPTQAWHKRNGTNPRQQLRNRHLKLGDRELDQSKTGGTFL